MTVDATIRAAAAVDAAGVRRVRAAWHAAYDEAVGARRGVYAKQL
jgi:hypothetical protein